MDLPVRNRVSLALVHHGSGNGKGCTGCYCGKGGQLNGRVRGGAA